MLRGIYMCVVEEENDKMQDRDHTLMQERDCEKNLINEVLMMFLRERLPAVYHSVQVCVHEVADQINILKICNKQ